MGVSTGRPFASRMHVALVVLMLLSFALIAQQTYKALYQAGFVLLIASTLVQIVFGNVEPGIVLTPALVNLGR